MTPMFVLLPIAAFGFLFLIVSRTHKACWRNSLLLSALIWAVLLVAITELLSLFRLLSFPWVVSVWVVVCLSFAMTYSAILRNKKTDQQSKVSIFISNGSLGELIQSEIASSKIKIWILGILLILIFVGLVALIAPPNTNDSMGYHMPRVMHWIQNRSVAHFPTNYTAQLFLSPWSAFAILHLQVLSGSDRYANLVQWFSMVGGVIGVSLIAQQLGANLYGQAFAAVFCATIPMGILQSSSTQNDYVVAFWMVCLAYYALCAIHDRTGKAFYWQVGISLGLATFSKPTAYLYAFPFLLWLLLEKGTRLRWKLFKPACQVTIPFFVINALHWARNLEVFSHPLGKSPDYIIYTNRAFSIPIFLSDIIRNLALHLSTPSPSVNHLLIQAVSFIHSLLGVDMNDPRTSSSHFQLNSLINHEDLASNTIHFLLIVVTIACFSFYWRKKIFHRILLNYLLCLILGFLLFCFLLAWTPFHTRLHLSLFVLFSAFIGCVLSKVWSLRLVNVLAVVLLITALPWVFLNESRPLIANSNFMKTGAIENIFNTSRTDLYFLGRKDMEVPITSAVEFIKSSHCSNIGITFDKLDIYEYPIWALLQSEVDRPYRIQHIGVNNPSVAKQQDDPFKGFNPCIIFDDGSNFLEKNPSWRSQYTEALVKLPVRVFVKTGS